MQSNNSANVIDTGGTPSYQFVADKSGNGRNVEQVTKATQPLQVNSVLNGYPALYFEGTQYLDFVSAGLDIGRNISGFSGVFVCVPTLPPSGVGTVFQCSTNSAAGSNRISNYVSNVGTQGIAVRRADGDSQSNRAGGSISGATPYVLTYIYDVPGQSCYLYANETLSTSLEGSFGTFGAATSDTDSVRASIGALNAGSLYRGYVLEGVIYGLTFTSQQRQDVVGALLDKYAI